MRNNIETLIKKVQHKLERPKSISDLAICLTNYFLTYQYQGSENQLILKKYADYIYLNLLPYLTANDKHTFNLKHIILDAKIETYDERKRIFWKWMNNVIDLNMSSSDKIVQHLVKNYPSLDDKYLVKKELGLLQTLEELEEQYNG